MEKAKTDSPFEEMNAFLSENAVMSEAGTKDPDEDGLPYESLDDFSTDPAEFGELAERMLHKVENLFDLTAVFNRHSEKYLKACVLLEKGIKYLGSACLTKIALEHREYSFPELSQLSTMKLYRMASFNYRKLDAALTEKLKQGNDLYPELLDMEFRYFNLLRRLRSTEAKIYNYHYKKYYREEDFDPVIEGNAFSGSSWTKMYTQEREEAPAFRSAPAFPVIFQSEGRKARSADKASGVRDQVSEQGTRHETKSAANISGIREQAADQSTEREVQSGEKVSGVRGQVSEQSAEREAQSEEKVSGVREQVSEQSAERKAQSGDRVSGNVPAGNTGFSVRCPEAPAFGPRLPDSGSENDISDPSALISSPETSDPRDGAALPAFAGIIENVLNRSEENEDGALSFTCEEIKQLADDPEFCRFDPDMAGFLRQLRDQIPDST